MLLMFSIVVERYLHMRETDADQKIKVLEEDACTRADNADLWDGHVQSRGKAAAKC